MGDIITFNEGKHSMLHSNSLFHFTSKEGLLGILENNFYPRFSKEIFPTRDGFFSCWIPMCCFCDIPLSQVSSHMEKYGKYGLGMKRTWVEENKLNPVHYISSNSNYFDYFQELQMRIEMIGPLVVEEKFREEFVVDLANHSDFIFSYLKPYYKTSDETECYYDEREWRYVPTQVNENTKFLYSFHLLDDERERGRSNEEYEKYSLKFSPEDISYIVIKSDDERSEMIRKIKEIKSPKFSLSDIEVLLSKILSAKQITSDM